jgi:hypothetical protein
MEYVQHGCDILSHFMLDVATAQFNCMIIVLAWADINRVSHCLAEFVILLLDNLSVFQLGDNPSNRKEYL